MLKHARWLFVAAVMMASTLSHAVTVLDVSSGTARFGSGYMSTDYNTTFAEKYTFAVDDAFNVDSGIISVMSDSRFGLNLTGLELTNGTSTYNGSMYSTDPAVWTLNATNLVQGDYTLTVFGKVVGTQGGSFAGTINVASAVPEASTYLMLLAGLGLVAVATRRRSQVSSAHVGMLAA